MTTEVTSLPYHEPDIITILIQSGLILALNVVNSALDSVIYCGLVGQLLIGIAWGVPGANWLSRDMQVVIQQLGYLGLILMVYEGGLSTSISSLKANAVSCTLVAVTGVCVPIGLSFVLQAMINARPLQAFAAGAALCSTSLGTTFTVLSTTGLTKTRLGVLLSGAAMMDDVVGLVMVQVISNLGNDGSATFNTVTVVRPVFVSVGFAIGIFVLCRAAIRPVVLRLSTNFLQPHRVWNSFNLVVVIHLSILVGLVAGATFAGTSNLFAAYLAGVLVSWFDDTVSATRKCRKFESTGVGSCPTSMQERKMERPVSSGDETPHSSNQSHGIESPESGRSQAGPPVDGNIPTGAAVYEQFLKQPVNRILKPMFFASVGFSIPTVDMFRGKIIWRGIVYSILMMVGKMVTGLWLIQLPLRTKAKKLAHYATQRMRAGERHMEKSRSGRDSLNDQDRQRSDEDRSRPSDSSRIAGASPERRSLDPDGGCIRRALGELRSRRPQSLYPASIVGLAMVARGEIGFLIASLAFSNGVLKLPGADAEGDLYLIVIWAITLCTVIGPISVGIVVKRLRFLQEQRKDAEEGLDLVSNLR